METLSINVRLIVKDPRSASQSNTLTDDFTITFINESKTKTTALGSTSNISGENSMTEEAQAAIYWNKIYEKSQVNKAGVEPLNLTKLTINETGFLHLVFNKPIIRPPLKAVWKGERLLSQYR